MSKFPETVGIVSLIETSLLFKTDGIDAAQKFVTPKLKSMSITSLDIGLCFVQQLLEKVWGGPETCDNKFIKFL